VEAIAMDQKWKKRYPIWIGLAFGAHLFGLSACTKTLDTTKLESDIQQTVIRQGGLSLKTVACPKDVAMAAGKSFDCVGTLESGDLLAISVNQSDDKGTTTWDLPNTKGLLNLAKLGALFQQTIQQEGQVLIIDCGRGYRSVKPGDRFECKVSKIAEKAAKAQRLTEKKLENPKQPETIVVTIDPQSNVNWQQVFPAPTGADSSAKPTAVAANSSATEPDSAIAAEDREKLSPTILKKLDQMGGGDIE
jgi:hypothetical protein